MSAHTPTILLVHAHPDDEASTTGGVIARYAAAGVRVVLVTCTNGELGDSPTGHTPDDDGHDTAAVVVHRLAELDASCALLGVSRLVLLGYHDSGMMGWAQNDAPGSFWSTPLAESSAKLLEVLEEERPDVVITYDENGFYGHPDHIQANRITRAALESATFSPKLYYATIPLSGFARFSEVLAEHGVQPPQEEEEVPSELGVSDDQIGAIIDVQDFVGVKRAALAAHASQTAQSFFLTIPEAAFNELFGTEWFVSVTPATDQQVIEDDLLAGTSGEGLA